MPSHHGVNAGNLLVKMRNGEKNDKTTYPFCEEAGARNGFQPESG